MNKRERWNEKGMAPVRAAVAFFITPLLMAPIAHKLSPAGGTLGGLWLFLDYLVAACEMYVLLGAILVVVGLPLRLLKAYRIWLLIGCTVVVELVLVLLVFYAYSPRPWHDSLYAPFAAFIGLTVLTICVYWLIRRSWSPEPA